MTPAELNVALDAMQAAATSDADKPGLVTIATNDWIANLNAIKATCARLDDGLRISDLAPPFALPKTRPLRTMGQLAEVGGAAYSPLP